jgi:hypothetical protein
MAKLFTCKKDGFCMRAETDGERAAQMERHMAEAHADLAGRLDALPVDWRSGFATWLAPPSAPQLPTERTASAHPTPKARVLP